MKKALAIIAGIVMVLSTAAQLRPTNFAFERPDGSVDSLSHVMARNDTLLMILYNPDCSHCMAVIDSLRSESLPPVLAVCIDGTRAEWLESLPALPPQWMPAYDRGVIFANDLYIFPAPPAIYLITDNKLYERTPRL